MVDRPKSADELRARLRRLLRGARPHAVPSASLIPSTTPCCSPTRAWCRSSRYFVGDETPPYPRATSIAEVRPRRRQAQRPRRRRPHQPALHVLRDARQLQLRRLLQGRGDPVGVGALHRGPRPRPRAPVGDRPRRRRRGRADLARRGRLPRRADPAPGRATTSGAWPTPARAARPRRSSGTSVPSTVPTAARRANEDRYIEIWNLVFMQFDASSPTASWCRCRSRASTPAPGLERNLASLQGAASVWDIDVFRPLIAAAERSPASRYGTFPGPSATSRCASSPSTAAR